MRTDKVTDPKQGTPGGRLAWSVSEAADRSSLSVRTIWSAIREGRLRVVRVGKRVLVPERYLIQYLGIEGSTSKEG